MMENSRFTINKLFRSGNTSYLRICILITGMKDMELYTPADFVHRFASLIRELDVKRALSIKHGYRAKVVKPNEVEIAHYRLDGTYLYPTHRVVFNYKSN